MKNWKKSLISMFLVAVFFVLTAGNVFAAENEAYTYTVTFYAGAQGAFYGSGGVSVNNANSVVTRNADKIVVSNLNAGDIISVNAQAATKLDNSSKYYVQGVRQSGRDNDTISASVFTVNEDADYVVAYGIQGNMATYTVNYQDANGNTLAESQTYYGNVGDKPVVAYLYIDGYAPQAYGLTKTLSANDADNVFTFVYDRIPGPTVNVVTRPAQDTTTTTQDTDTDADTTTGTGTVTETTPGTTTETETETEAETGTVTEPETATEETTEEESNQPEIVDLDDEEVPLAGTDLEKEVSKSLPLVGIGAVLVAAIAALGVVFVYMKKRAK